MKRAFLKLSLPWQIFLIQLPIIFACAFFDWHHLVWWDGIWYSHITEIGYSAFFSADPTVNNLGNVGFFPGYPLAGYLVKQILGLGKVLSSDFALLIVSFAFAILSFKYLLKWLALWQDTHAREKTLLFALYPFTIFFYYIYTESLFCFLTLAFFYYTELLIRSLAAEKNSSSVTAKAQSQVIQKYFWFALCTGFYLNGTRMLGLVFSLYPVLRALQIKRGLKLSALLWVVTSSSVAAFFAYCHFKFGAWNLYFITENKIWGTRVDWSKLFPPTLLFDFSRPLRGDTTGKYVTLGIGFYLSYLLIRLIRAKDFKNPLLALVLVCGMFWGENLIGRTSWDYAGMGRYLIPALALMLPFMEIKPKRNYTWGFIVLLFISLQIAYALKFGRHGWVA